MINKDPKIQEPDAVPSKGARPSVGGRHRLFVILGAIALAAVVLWIILVPQKTDYGTIPLADGKPALVKMKPKTSVAEVSTPSFDVVRVSREGTGVIAGRAAPGATVSILADGKSLSDVQADQRGDWALIFDSPLPSGGTRLILIAKGADGVELASRDEVILSVPMPNGAGKAVPKNGKPDVPLENFIDPVDEGVVAVRVTHVAAGAALTAEFASEVLQRPSASADYLSDVSLDAVDYDATGAAVFIGRGKGRREVRIYLDDQFIAGVMVGDDGRWIQAMPQPLTDKIYRLRLDQLGDKGDVDARVELGLRLRPDPKADEIKTDYSVAEKKVESGRVWRIAHKRSDGGLVYTQVIGPDSTQIRDVKIVYPGQNMAIPARGK